MDSAITSQMTSFFPSSVVPILVPFLGVKDFIKVRQTFRDLFGDGIDESLCYPHEVQMLDDGRNENIWAKVTAGGERVFESFPRILICGFAKISIVLFPDFDKMMDMLIPNADYLVSLEYKDVGRPYQQTKTEGVFPKLRELRLKFWADLNDWAHISCPAIEKLHVLYPSHDVRSFVMEPRFVSNHSHLIHHLTISSDWFRETKGSNLPSLHRFKMLIELVVFDRAWWIWKRNDNGTIQINDNKLNFKMSVDEFHRLPISLHFPLYEDADIPKFIYYGYSQSPTNIEESLMLFRKRTKLSVLTFITNKEYSRCCQPFFLMYRDYTVYQFSELLPGKVETEKFHLRVE